MKLIVSPRFGALVLAGLLTACGGKSDKELLDEKKKEQAALTKEIKDLEAKVAKSNPDSVAVKTKAVAVTEVQPRKFEHFIQTQGKIDAEDNILVSAQSAGVVTQVFVKEGQTVSKGQVLAQIDNSMVQRSIDAQRTQLELANTVYERQKNLWSQKIGTEVQYLQAKTNKESLERQLASLQEQNDMTRIKAPVSGTVDHVTVKIGENIAPGMPAVRVVNTSNLKLIANVSEAYVTTVKKGDKARVILPDLDNKEIEAKVTFVGKTIDQLSRSFSVEVKLPSQADLRPNMTAVLKVIYKTEASTMVVPVNLIQTVNNEKIIYTIEEKGKQSVARRKVVKVEGVFDNLAQVDGLTAGDKIITVGYQGLNDGQPVKL